MIDPNLREFATDRQAEFIDAINEHGSATKAGAALGINRRTVDKSIRRLKVHAAKQGYSPEHDLTHVVPDGYTVKGASTYYDSDGNIKAQWIKSQVDAERQKAMLDAVLAGMCEEIPQRKPSKPVPKTSNKDLLNCYILTDYHLGMLSDPEETGAAWDLKIAEKLLLDWFEAGVAQAPDAQVAIFAQLGDMLHFDGLEAVTPTSGHILDADTRFQRVVRVAIRCIRKIIDLLLSKYPQVHIIMADANHDPSSAVWMREFLAAMYEKEKRLFVDTSPDTYYCYEWGSTSLFFHHGHKKKPTSIDDVFASKFREVFGRTKNSYAHMGHMHHVWAQETNLMVVEQHRTLAAGDAYSSRGGWLSGRSSDIITYRKEFGQVGRVTLSPEMFK